MRAPDPNRDHCLVQAQKGFLQGRVDFTRRVMMGVSIAFVRMKIQVKPGVYERWGDHLSVDVGTGPDDCEAVQFLPGFGDLPDDELVCADITHGE